jgi:hypothetical protein|tara:strand:+ start:718 stop:1161 length:444 start_codon:yes stop_codon:yes gene_type:complete
MSRKNKPIDVYRHINMHEGDEDVCWEWQLKLNAKDSRPYFTVDGKRRPSYAYVLETKTGEAQDDRMVLHSCDNPICCNPFHLSWGTHQDNMNEMKERERHGLPTTVVRAIRRLLSEGGTHKDIANLYGVSRETITAINNGRSHKDKD